MKRLLCIFLTIMLCLSLSSVTALAEEEALNREIEESLAGETEGIIGEPDDVSDVEEGADPAFADDEDQPYVEDDEAVVDDAILPDTGDDAEGVDDAETAATLQEEPVIEDVEEAPTLDGADGRVLISTDYFPDPVFQHYVLKNFDTNGDQWLDQNEMEAVTTIDLSESRFRDNLPTVTSVKGIEYFPNLIWLDCTGNALKELDVSKNTKLESLFLGIMYMKAVVPDKEGNILENARNELKNLDVSHNPKLKDLNCDYNYLQALDVSHNPDLESLSCTGNAITALDVSHNPQLIRLDCYNNAITALDLGNNTKLEWIWAYGNQIKSLDLSKCPTLAEIAEANNTSIYNHDGVTVTSYLWDIGEEFLAEMIICDYGTTIIYKDACLMGDADGDGTVTRADRIYLARYLANWPDYMNIDKVAADVNKDGLVNRADRTYLARALAHWPDYPLT